jgi:7,8-dihydroneopterin aldolase/epimerase/oxygenase
MLTIHLKSIRCLAHHGIFAEEKILGNEYEVDILIQCVTQTVIIQHLSETIDYATVYQLLQKRMQKPTPLLETIASDFSYMILQDFPLAQSIRFSIHKMHPPIEGLIGQVGVIFDLDRSQLNH